MKRGKLIALEGIDGSGKDTQARMLLQRLRQERYRAILLSFPRYKKKSGTLVEEYLRGKYGSPKEVGPHRAAIFYAADRYAASSEIRNLLQRGFVVIADRYVGSNLAHQGGKIRAILQKRRFYRWVLSLEYSLFGIPKPAVSIILDIPSRLAAALRFQRKTRRNRLRRDVHEYDRAHLLEAYRAYQELARFYPRDFRLISCTFGNTLLTKQQIHAKIWYLIKGIV